MGGKREATVKSWNTNGTVLENVDSTQPPEHFPEVDYRRLADIRGATDLHDH